MEEVPPGAEPAHERGGHKEHDSDGGAKVGEAGHPQARAREACQAIAHTRHGADVPGAHHAQPVQREEGVEPVRAVAHLILALVGPHGQPGK